MKAGVSILHLLLCLLLGIAEAKTRHYRREIAYQLKSPDCFQKLAVTINGQSPGPIIRAEQGDLIIVEVKNKLFTENTAIHWHGIRQIGTPRSDGIGGVTQCPILPGETFVYKFVVDRQGTYIYHAHYGMQRVAGLHGSIIVSPPTRPSYVTSPPNTQKSLLNKDESTLPQETYDYKSHDMRKALPNEKVIYHDRVERDIRISERFETSPHTNHGVHSDQVLANGLPASSKRKRNGMLPPAMPRASRGHETGSPKPKSVVAVGAMEGDGLVKMYIVGRQGQMKMNFILC